MKKIICEKVPKKYVAYFICKNGIRESELNLAKKNFRNVDYYEVTGKYCQIIQREFIANPPSYTDTITFVLTAKGHFVYKGKSDVGCSFKVALFYHTKKAAYYRIVAKTD